MRCSRNASKSKFMPNLQSNYNAESYPNPFAFEQTALELPVTLELNTLIPEDDIARTVLKAVSESGVYRYIVNNSRNSHGFRCQEMLKAVILANTQLGIASVREMEDLARNDIRYRLIFRDGVTPSFMSFQRFIHDDLTVSVETVLTEVNKYMKRILPDDIDTKTEVIDGTKEEADANKMSFVWRGSSEKYQKKAYKKVFELLKDVIAFFNESGFRHNLSILRMPDLKYLLEICTVLERYMKDNDIAFVYGKGKKKTQLQRWYDQLKDCAVKLWKYEMHFDILDDRNSFSKSDPDATFMHMKYDYYNHTNVFKPGYNVQFGSCSGLIWDIYISSAGNDMEAYIPLMEQHKRNYGSYPERTPADAGYGSYDNYHFCKDNRIEPYMKYPGYEAEKKKVNDRNRFKAIHFRDNEDGMPVCPAGHAFRVEKVRTETRGVYPRQMETLVNDHCEGCPFASKCTKSKDGIRRIQRCVQLNEWKKEVRDNLNTEFGKAAMTLRQVFSEGIFGDKKYNWNYDKMRRVGESGVKTEIYMYALGKNMRRFHLLYWNRVRANRINGPKVTELMGFLHQNNRTQA